MSVQTKPFGLKRGHITPFRRTINLGTPEVPEPITLIFEPDVKYELTAQEVAGIQHDIDAGMVVPWGEDPSGRRATRALPGETAETLKAANEALTARVDELELDIAAADEQIALLIDQVKELGGEPIVEQHDEPETDNDPEKTEDKPKRGRKKKTE